MSVAGPATADTILLVEDDHGDAVLVQASLAESDVADLTVVWTRTLGAALASLPGRIACVLLDLGLPDAAGVSAVRKMVDAAPDVAVIVLTGRQERDGVDALAAGAQDYLVKGAITGEVLQRSIRYAMERKRAQRVQQQLRDARLNAAEQARLERGLLPTPLLRTDAVRCATHYRPGSDGAVLGGDFYDVVETSDGTVRAIIGDVMGHGPDEAALGVHLRVAWRTLLLAGLPDTQILPTLALLLHSEDGARTRFVTACDVTLTGDRMTLRVAGHPAPVLCARGSADYLELESGLPLGVEPPDGADEMAGRWPDREVEVPPGSSVLLYTDGLLDAFAVDVSDPGLGIPELVAAVHDCSADGSPASSWIPNLLASAPREPLDDTAIVVLTTAAAT